MAADVSGLKAAATRRYRRLAEESGQVMKAELRVKAPHRTYELRNSIEASTIQSGATTFRTTLTAPVVQAVTTNSGARPHIIRPRSAKMLSFYWPKVGARVAFRFVHHPGNRGTTWWTRVLDRRAGVLRAVLGRL